MDSQSVIVVTHISALVTVYAGRRGRVCSRCASSPHFRKLALGLAYLEVALITPLRSPGVLHDPVSIPILLSLSHNFDGMSTHLLTRRVVLNPRMLVHEVRLHYESCLNRTLLEFFFEVFNCAQQALIFCFEDFAPFTAVGTRGIASLTESL